MSIRTLTELRKMRAIGKIVRLALDEMAAAVKPGVTTAGLDAVGAAVLAAFGAESSPPRVYGFPGAVCISVNDEAVHGIPGERTLAEGDLVKLDLTAEKDGFVADSAVTVRVGRVSAEADALVRCAESAFELALEAAAVGGRVNEIGRAVEREVKGRGFSVIRELCGHGVGRTIHEDPCVLNYYEPRMRDVLTDGLVITIEPIISAGNGSSYAKPGEWPVRTADRSLAAHYEHTIAVTTSGPFVLTA